MPVFRYKGLPVKRVLPVNSPVVPTAEVTAEVLPEQIPVVEPVTTEEVKEGKKRKDSSVATEESKEKGI